MTSVLSKAKNHLDREDHDDRPDPETGETRASKRRSHLIFLLGAAVVVAVIIAFVG